MHTRRRNQKEIRAKTERWALDDALQGHDKKLRILVLIQRAMRTAQGRQSGAWGGEEAPWWGLICGDRTKRKLPREAGLSGPWMRLRWTGWEEGRRRKGGSALQNRASSEHAPGEGPLALENKHLKSSAEQRGLCKTVMVVAQSQMAAKWICGTHNSNVSSCLSLVS